MGGGRKERRGGRKERRGGRREGRGGRREKRRGRREKKKEGEGKNKGEKIKKKKGKGEERGKKEIWLFKKHPIFYHFKEEAKEYLAISNNVPQKAFGNTSMVYH